MPQRHQYGVIDKNAATVGSRRLSRSKTPPTERTALRAIAARRAQAARTASSTVSAIQGDRKAARNGARITGLNRAILPGTELVNGDGARFVIDEPGSAVEVKS